jgi:Glycosyl hydrolases family 18
MASIVIKKTDNRSIDALKVTVTFIADNARHEDWEDEGSFNESIENTLDAHHGKWRKEDSTWIGNFLRQTKRHADQSDVTLTIYKKDDRAITSLRVFVEFSTGGVNYADFEDFGEFAGDIQLVLNGEGGQLDATRNLMVGDFLTKPKPQANNRVVLAWVGARAEGLALPDLASIPVDPSLDFFFALAFLQDPQRDGAFQPYDGNDTTFATYDAATIARLRSENPRRRFLGSLAGGTFPWQTPSNQGAWIERAYGSLARLMDSLHLDGLDLNYEQGLDRPGFVECFAQVVERLKANKNAIITLAPFAGTWAVYKRLYEATPQSIDWINYQAYADLERSTDPNQYFALYERLQQGIGYPKFTLGANTSKSGPRGAGPEVINQVLSGLKAKGIRGVAIWALEVSAPDYRLESSVEQTLR